MKTLELKSYMKKHKLKLGQSLIIDEAKTSVKAIIPMRDCNGIIFNHEILINRKSNSYFGISQYFEGRSWAKEVLVQVDKHDKRVKIVRYKRSL